MKRKKWSSKMKWQAVVEGLKGRPVADICTEYGLAQSQYYKWRDQFFSEGFKIFDVAQTDQKQLYLERENKKLKGLVGELTLELKKSEELME
jgi:transposase-like protein